MAGRRCRTPWVAAALLSVLGVTLGCAHADYVWVDDVAKNLPPPDDGYRIGPGDVIGVRVWNQEANSIERARVREDGKISMPFLNDVEVAGVGPVDLARQLEAMLKPYIVKPVVTVMVHERRPLRVSVLGKVTRPGLYDLENGDGVLNALAAAGGMTPFAHEDRVFVLRRASPGVRDAAPTRIRFDYRALRSGAVPAATFRLRASDVVVVE
jgi:polysaccharide export outer membrane protein